MLKGTQANGILQSTWGGWFTCQILCSVLEPPGSRPCKGVELLLPLQPLVPDPMLYCNNVLVLEGRPLGHGELASHHFIVCGL